ncbi:hypothetical protein [Bacillus mycoides]|uniref:hypothetical protein n=1 Tax=Bacillus mycoides TaxID=1405 RepID=UPI002E1D73E7|nr:hypothetical protein [Bacillus mycoides]
MEDIDVINHRLEVLETTAQQMYAEKMIMQGQINALYVTVDGLKQYIGDLERKLSEKADVTDIKVVTRSEIIKKINDSKSVGMDCKVGVSLNGRGVAESLVEQTADAIKISANDIQGVRTNETN